MNRIRRTRPTAFALLFAAALLVATPAAAAPPGWESVDVTVHGEQSRAVLLVSGTLPQSAPLPAEVELSVPAGAQLQWAGEILGGPVDQDPTVTYSKATTAGTDVYRFQLTKARTGQIEAIVPWITFDGQTYGVAAKWTANQDIPTVNVSVRVPSDAQITSESAGASLKPSNEAAWKYYAKTFTGVKAGQTLDASFSYTSATPAGAAPAGTAAAPSGGGGGTGSIVLVLLAGVAVVLAVIAVSRRRSPAPLEDGEEEVDDPDAEETEAASGSAAGVSNRTKAFAVVGALALVVWGVVGITNATNAPAWTDGVLRKDFAGNGACTVTNIPLTAKGDLKKDGGKLFDALRQLQSIGEVKLYADQPRIEIEFCESVTSPEAISTVLASTGIVTLGQPQTRKIGEAPPSGTTTAPAPAGQTTSP